MPSKRTTTPMTDVAIKVLIAQGVATALAEYEANRGNGNGDDSHDSGSGERRQVSTVCECTYSDFLKCQPLNFKGTEGVVDLTQWFEKMESVFHISNYTIACQFKFATCTLLGSAVTWWNSHLSINEWKEMFLEESDQVEKFVDGLPDMIQGSVMASKPKIMQEVIEIANDLMDKKVGTFAERQVENKRKLDNNSSDNNAQQLPFKRQNVARAYSAGPSEKKEYAGTLPLCNKCKNQGHYRSDCPEIKNRNHGNQSGCTEVFSIWKAFRGNTRDLGSFGEETDKTTDLHQHLSKKVNTQNPGDACSTRLNPFKYGYSSVGRFDVFFRDQLLVFQQHQDESLYDSWTRFKDVIRKVPNHGLSIWTLIEIFLKHLDSLSRHIINLTAEGDLRKFSDIGAWVQVPRCMAWLDYDEHVDSLSMMDNEVGVTIPESTT
ncbi:reverse transcriptase domain-containing protein [Tanacetum coccineum]